MLKGRQYACQWCTEYGNWPKCGWKQGNSVPMYMHSDALPARGEESGGSSFLHACGASCERCANASAFHTLSSCKASNLYKCTPVCKHLLTTHQRDRTHQHPPKVRRCVHLLAAHWGQRLRAWVLSGRSIATCPRPCSLWLETKNHGWISGSHGWNFVLERMPQVQAPGLSSFSPVSIPISSCEASNLHIPSDYCHLLLTPHSG